MNKIKNLIKGNKYSIIAFLLTALCLIVSFSVSNRMIGGKFLIYEGDFFAQTICFIKQFYRDLFDLDILLGKGKLFYSPNASLGENMSAVYACYSMFSPFNLLYLIFDDMNLASILLIISKISMASFFFQKFCKIVLKSDNYYSVLFSMLYAMCGFNVMYYYNVQFLDGIFMLPLIEVAIYKLVKEGKFIFLSICYTYLFISCFFSGYVVGFFSLISLIAFIVIEYKNKKWLLNILIKYGISFVISVLLSSFLLVPAAIYIFNNIAADKTEFDLGSGNIINVLGNLFIGMNQGKNLLFPYIYSGIITVLSIPLFFTNKNISKKIKITVAYVLGFMFISCIFMPLYEFWHCFDAPDTCQYRFAYLISFIMIGMLAYECKYIASLSKIKLIITSLCFIAFYILVHYIQENSLEESYCSTSVLGLEINGIYIILSALVLYFYSKNSNKGIYKFGFSLLIFTELALNCFFSLSSSTYSASMYKDNFNSLYEDDKAAIEDIKNNDDSVYRICHTNKINDNESILLNYMGMGYFSTFENYQLRNTLSKLGIATSTRVILDSGQTNGLMMILAEKYKLSTNDILHYDIEDYEYVENKYSLNLAFMCDKAIKDFNIDDESDDAFENQNGLLSALCGNRIDYFYAPDGEFNYTTNNMDFYNCDYYNYVMEAIDKEKDQEAVFTYDVQDVNDLYLYISNYWSYCYANTVSPWIDTNDRDNYNGEKFNEISMPKITRLGKNDEGLYEFIIKADSDTADGNMIFKNIYLYLENMEELEKAYNILSKEQLNINEFNNGYLSGNITVENDNVLFTSIPYDKFWHVYVDGIETDTLALVNNTFLGVELTKGEHTIVMEYKNEAVLVGMIMSFAGLFFLTAAIIYNRKLIKKSHYSPL